MGKNINRSLVAMFVMNSLKRMRLFCLLPLAVVCCFDSGAQSSSNLMEPLVNAPVSWGKESNGLRSGLMWATESNRQIISVLVHRASSNAVERCVAPPEGRFAVMELRDVNGDVIQPNHEGARMVAEMPLKIAVAELPKTPQSGWFSGRGAMYKNPVMFGSDGIADLKQFTVQDAYTIEKEGDYKLTVWPSIYRFATNSNYVARIDIPPVTATLHLMKGPTRSNFSVKVIGIGALGAGLCALGVSCFIFFRRRAHNRPTS
jgi:hypothetical protein